MRGEAHGSAVARTLRHAAADPAFRSAIAAGDPAALRAAIVGLFRDNHFHIVRVRAWRGAQLIDDVGGPYVLSPATGTIAARGAPSPAASCSPSRTTPGSSSSSTASPAPTSSLHTSTGTVPGSNLSPGPAFVPGLGTVTYQRPSPTAPSGSPAPRSRPGRSTSRCSCANAIATFARPFAIASLRPCVSVPPREGAEGCVTRSRAHPLGVAVPDGDAPIHRESRACPNALPGLTVVLPCFNEAENVADAIRYATAAAERCATAHQIVVVDDGSSDATAAIAAHFANRDRRVRLVVHSAQPGLRRRVRSGIAAARMPWVLLTDADLQFDLDELEDFLPLAARPTSSSAGGSCARTRSTGASTPPRGTGWCAAPSRCPCATSTVPSS